MLAIIALLGISLVLAPRGGDLALVAVAAVMAVASFVSVRNVAFGVIAASVPLTRHAGIITERWRARSSAIADSFVVPATVPLSPLSQAIIGMLALMLAVESGLFSRKIPAAMRYPNGAIAFMQSHQLHGNILDYFVWGQYLIWHVSASSKIFIDGRYDLSYPPKVITDYIDFYDGRPRAAQVLASYPHDLVLISPEAKAFGFMRARQDWKLIYHDQDAALFARSDSRAAQLSSKPFTSAVAQSYFP